MDILYLPNSDSQQRQLEKPVWIYPVRLAMEATRDSMAGHKVRWYPDCPFPVFHFTISQIHWCEGVFYDEVVTEPRYKDFLSLPMPDRRFTGALDARYQLYGNYKFHPATHMLSASGCWHARCGFCIERGTEMQVRPVSAIIKEIQSCKDMGIREIFDDSATMPDKKWLSDLCDQKILAGLDSVTLGCNMRIDSRADYPQMKRAGFRMLLYGIESASQRILDQIQKGIYVKDIVPTIKAAAECGLEPHGTFMFGYPGASEEEELATLNLCHFLLKKGYLKTAQASVYSPPRTKPDPKSPGHKYTKRIYEAGYSPVFWINKLSDLRKWEDLVYLLKGIRKGLVRD